MDYYIIQTFISLSIFALSYVGGANLVDEFYDRAIGWLFVALSSIVSTVSGLVFVYYLFMLSENITYKLIDYIIGKLL